MNRFDKTLLLKIFISMRKIKYRRKVFSDILKHSPYYCINNVSETFVKLDPGDNNLPEDSIYSLKKIFKWSSISDFNFAFDRLSDIANIYAYKKVNEWIRNFRSKERIICSAVWYKDLELSNPKALEPKNFRPQGCDRGIVFSGWRHANCIYQMCAITGKKNSQVGEYVSGFITSKNRFVEREEAGKIAKNSRQVEDLKYSSNKLYSEDLY